MKLTKFQISNYKSIKDSGWCFTTNDVTVLAGKNESGKTAALEALRDFDKSINTFPEAVFPLEEVSNHNPTVSILFSLDAEEQNSILENASEGMRSHLEKVSLEAILIEKRVRSPGEDAEYNCPQIGKILEPWHSNEMQSHREEYEEVLKGLSEKGLSTDLRPFSKAKSASKLWQFSDEIYTISKDRRLAIQKQAKERNGETPEGSEATPVIYTDKEKSYLDFYGSIMQIALNMDESKNAEEVFVDKIVLLTPNFVFFSSFEDTLPFEIPIEKAVKNSAIQDFFRAAKIDLDKILARTDRQRRDNAMKTKSIAITGDFQTFWQQDKITLKPHIDGENLIFEFEEEGKVETFSFDQRSKGFQWFLTFYLKLMVEGSKSGHDILLIDEPGLYLHAKAQKDVLKLFERLSKEGRHVIISTHSPYLIDVDHLNRVKIVAKSKSKGTKIQNKVHANATQDTLTPIITAIGLNIGATLQSNFKNNIITEGISDYYYLLAAAELIPCEKDNIAVIPATGAPATPIIASILIGWGLNVSVLLDNDAAGKAAKSKLKKLDLVDQKIIIPEQEGEKIEDNFTHYDFQNFVAVLAEPDDSKTNQQIINERNLDKVLLAKNFYERVVSKEIDRSNFSEGTINKLTALWDSLKASFI